MIKKLIYKNWKLLVIAVLFFFSFFCVISIFQNRLQLLKNKQNLQSSVVWLIGNNKVIFQQKKLSGRLYDVGDIYSIQKADYPKLFENLDYNVIKVTPFNVGTKTFYLISNVFYQAAGYTLDYAIVVDIWAKKPVLYETNKYNIQGSGYEPQKLYHHLV